MIFEPLVRFGLSILGTKMAAILDLVNKSLTYVAELYFIGFGDWTRWPFCKAHFYLPRRRRPGTGDIATPPRLSVCPSVRPSVRPSVCPSVRPSVTFSFRTVTQKRIDVFSRNFAGTCTMSWGCAV